MRTFLKLLVSVIGVAALVFGLIFIFQSTSAKNQVADSIAPLTLDKLNSQYDAVNAQYEQLMAAEQPNISAGKAAPSVNYSYMTAERVGLGLAKSNVGTANLLLTMGAIDIVVGLGLLVAGFLIPGKSKSP